MVRSRIGVVKLKPQDIAFGRTQYVSNCSSLRKPRRSPNDSKLTSFNHLDRLSSAPMAAPTHVVEGLWQISLGAVNAFLIDDGELTLIDTGLPKSDDKIAIPRRGLDNTQRGNEWNVVNS